MSLVYAVLVSADSLDEASLEQALGSPVREAAVAGGNGWIYENGKLPFQDKITTGD